MAAPINPNVKSITIKAGDTGIIRSDVKIISVGVDGAATIDSSCELPEPENYQCYYFKMGVDDMSDTDLVPFNEESARINQIIVGGNTYQFTGNSANGREGLVIDWIGSGSMFNPSTYPTDEINAVVPNGLMKVYKVVHEGHTKGDAKYIYVKMIPSVAATAEMKLLGEFFEGAWVRPVQADCDEPEV